MGILERVNDTIASHGKSASFFDPSTLGDPVADASEWTPIQATNAQVICLYRAKMISETKFEFVPPASKPTLSIGFIVFGLLLIGAGLFVGASGGDRSAMYGMGICGIITAVLGFLGTRMKDQPLVFDSDTGCQLAGSDCNMEDIYAIQIVPKKAYQDIANMKKWFYNFELNLVLTNSKRVYLLAHWDIATIREDAQLLAEFLAVPLWDTSPEIEIGEVQLYELVKQMRRKYPSEVANKEASGD